MGSGDDRAKTLDGRDALLGEEGLDRLKAGDGFDFIEGGLERDMLFSGTKNEQRKVDDFNDFDPATPAVDNTLDRDWFLFDRFDSVYTMGESDVVVNFGAQVSAAPGNNDHLYFVASTGDQKEVRPTLLSPTSSWLKR